ncbi:MAG: DUF4350 domain-containing protein, partial [Rhodanobacteraceae bacterium]
SLAPASRGLLAQLPGEIKVTSYAKPDSGLRPTVAAFIARYQRFKPDMTLAFVDPDADPAATREAGIQVNGELTITWHDHTLHLTELSDSQFANTLARLARGGERMVAFVTGDGERNAAGKANADLGQFMAALEQRGLRALPLNFAQVGQVPQNTDLVVLASPLATVGTGAVHALLDYLARGGNLLWLTEPDPRDLGLKPLARALDIQVLPGMLVDGGGAALGLKDPRVVAVGTYPQHAITDGFALTTVFPQVAPLAKVAAQGWDIRPILSSGPQSWNELEPIDNQNQSTIQYDADAGELKGPLDFGFALTRLSPSPDKREQRVVVIGDGDFLSNSFLGNAGNAALGRRIFNWLLGDDKLVTLPPRPAPDRHLDLSQTGLTVLAFGLLLVLPLLLLLLTAVMAWRRRRR